MNLVDLREKRNKLMHDAQQIQLAGDFTVEGRAKFDALIADVDSVEADIDRLERTAKFEEEQRTAKANRPVPAASEERSVLEKRAFVDYVKFGRLPEQRDLLTINSSGQAIIPQAYSPVISDAQKAYGQLISILGKLDTDSGAPMKHSLTNDTANLMVPVTEGTAGTPADPGTNSIMINTDELQTSVKVSLAELQDASFDLDAFLRDKFGFRYFRGLSKLVCDGSSTNIASVITGYSSGAVQTAATGAVAYADLVKLYGSLDPAYMATRLG